MRIGPWFFGGPLAIAEDAGRLDDDFHTQVLPRQSPRVLLGEHLDPVVADIDVAVHDFDSSGEDAVVGVILEQVGVCRGIEKIVDRHDFELLRVELQHGFQDLAADSAKAVYSYSGCHE